MSCARHAHFQVFSHKITSCIEVEGLVGIATVDEMTKNRLCQEKSASRNLFTVTDFGLEKENNMVRLS